MWEHPAVENNIIKKKVIEKSKRTKMKEMGQPSQYDLPAMF